MPTSRQKARASAWALLFALTSACDVPTELPKWDTTFVVKSESTTFSVGQILPASVSLANNNSAFSLSLSPSSFSQTLGSLCAACGPLNNQTAPKPAFTQSFSTTVALPTDVRSAALTSGSINISIHNGFSFDPLRPSATARGKLTITITSAGNTIGSSVVDGATTAFPPGSTLPVTVPLTAGSISNSLLITVNVESPAGDPAQINSSQQLTATATPTAVTVSSAQINVTNRQVTAAQSELDLSGIDDFVIDHVKAGALLFAINNPFSVSGTLMLTLTGGDRTITKFVAVAPGQTNVEVPFDASELQAILGHTITMTLAGPVNAPAGVTVTPAQVLTVATRLKLILGPED
ncbi:MAG: hypothetical protein ACT4O1_16225 [Gemmatimonadota bacterium]